MQRGLTLEQKLDLLITHAVDDADGDGSALGSRASAVVPPRLRHARTTGALGPLNLRTVRFGSDGHRGTLLRVLMTNACSLNCHYCPMRRDRDLPHAAQA